MDLIDRKLAIDALRVAYWDDNIQSAKDDPCIVDAMTDWAIRQVKALPSAQPEIIRCKECRYSGYDSIFHSRYCHNKGKAELVGDNFFCAAGRHQTNGSD